MAQFSEYTKVRDIVVKRLKRRGFKEKDIDKLVPKLRDLRKSNNSENLIQENFERFTKFIKDTDIQREAKISARKSLYDTPEKMREHKRKLARDYRRRKAAREIEATTKYKPEKEGQFLYYVKAAETMHMNLTPKQMAGWAEYVEMRFAQGSTKGLYLIDKYRDDYLSLIRKGYNPKMIASDFAKFQADQARLQNNADIMEGITQDMAQDLWTKFIGD